MPFLGLPLRHLPPLFIGFSVTIACSISYFDIAAGIRAYGLPERIASSPSALSPSLLYVNRMQTVGMMILAFYYAKGEYAAVDTVMSFVGVHAIADVYVCRKEGVPMPRSLGRDGSGRCIVGIGWYDIRELTGSWMRDHLECACWGAATRTPRLESAMDDLATP